MAVNIQNWLVAVDDSTTASWAFNYATTLMDKQNGHLFILNVHYEPTTITGAYNAPNLAKEWSEVEELRAKKVLVHYGLKAQQLGVRFTLMKGMFYHAGELICQMVKRYNIKHVITGRREIAEFKRWMTGSTSKYIMENVEDCNVTIVKTPIGTTFDQSLIEAEKAELIHLIHQIEEVEGEFKPLTERIAEGVTETKDRMVAGVTETKDRMVAGVTETKDRMVAGVTETKDRIMEGVNPIKERIVESVTETKEKLAEGAQVVKEESKRVLDEARLAKERATLEAKVAKDCIVDEAKHVNLEAKIGKDRVKYRLADVFAFDESKQKQYYTEDQTQVIGGEPKFLTEDQKLTLGGEPKILIEEQKITLGSGPK
jgi:nucleotide-binding universal stress UspA family protein